MNCSRIRKISFEAKWRRKKFVRISRSWKLSHFVVKILSKVICAARIRHSSDDLHLLISWLKWISWSWQEDKTSLVLQVRKLLLEKVWASVTAVVIGPRPMATRVPALGCAAPTWVLKMCWRIPLDCIFCLEVPIYSSFELQYGWGFIYPYVYIYIQKHMDIKYIYIYIVVVALHFSVKHK